MATSKTLAPTNVTISIPAMAEQPNASVLANCADKEADAINALNSQLTSVSSGSLHDIVKSGVYFLTSAVSDKPVMESGYGGTYQVAVGGSAGNPVIAGTFVSMYDCSVWSVRCLNGTWTYTNISGKALIKSAATTHNFTFPNQSTNLIMVDGQGGSRQYMALVYNSTNSLSIFQLAKGDNVTVANSGSTLGVTFNQSMGCTARIINVSGSGDVN